MSQNKTSISKATKNKLVVTALLLVFAVPNLIVLYIHYTGQRFDLKSSNKGTLIEPQVKFDISDLKTLDGADFKISSLKDSWSLITIESSDCNERCMNNIYKLQQVRRRMSVERSRVSRLVFLQDSDNLDEFKTKLENFPRTTALTLSNEQKQRIFAIFNSITPTQNGTIFILDPLGDLILYYSPDVHYEDLINDLARLLKVSKIG